MSRLFFFSPSKQFSICFPFTVYEKNENLIFKSQTGLEIDSLVSSQVLNIVSNDAFLENSSFEDFFDTIDQYGDHEYYFWSLIQELLFFEDGYIRYDDDPNNNKGPSHPRMHYDIFYSKKSTFKIGLNSYLGNNQLVDLLNTETNCHFMHDVTIT